MKLLCRLLLLGATCVSAFKTGAPTTACDSMTPSHDGIPAQSSIPPYTLTPNSTAVLGGERILLRLQTGDSGRFKGFLIQSRDSSDDARTGTFFSATHNTITCGKGLHNAVTHTSPDEKSTVTVEWEAPSDFEGDVTFRATIVQSYRTFWTGLLSEKVSVKKREAGSAGVTRQPETTTTTKPPPRGVEKAVKEIYVGCGSIKTCIGIPGGCVGKESCKMMTSFTKVDDEKYEFELISSAGSGDSYAAVGLSLDANMGEDSVVACASYNGVIDVYNSWNEGQNNVPVVDKRAGLSVSESGVFEGKLYCRYHRKAMTEFNNIKFDLNKETYHILIATGSISSRGSIQYHGRNNREHTSQFINLGLTSKPVFASGVPFEDIHAALMIIAWIGAASCGMLFARYYKKTWLNYKCMNIDQWFHMHRLCMILTWSLTIAAFVLIVFKVKDFRTINHAYIGIVSIGLCFIQPFIAMCRPGPTAKNRPVFNWVHWFVGNSAQILGIAAIFLGLELKFGENERNWIKETMWYILVIFIAFHALIHLILSFAQCRSDRSSPKSSEVFPLKDLSDSRTPLQSEKFREDAPCGGLRKFLLGIYLPVNWIATALLVICVIIKKSDIEDQFKVWGISPFWEEIEARGNA